MTTAAAAASYFSGFLNQASSKYNTLRRQLIANDADGDTEDDSHISRVLRAYYTEKGRPFPDWLPPDPKAPPPQVVAPVSLQQQGGYGGYGGGGRQPGGGGRLGDLWDGPGAGQQAQPAGSLRRGGGVPERQGPPGGGRFADLYGDNKGGAASPGYAQQVPQQPSPGFRVPGGREQVASPAPSGASGSTAKDMLKARLWGNSRTSSPTQTPPASSAGYGRDEQPGRFGSGSSSGGGGAAYGNQSQGSGYGGRDDGYASNSGGRAGGFGQPAPPQNQYADRRAGSGDSGARPGMYSNSSWSSQEGSSSSSGRGYGGGYGGSNPYGQQGSGQRLPPGRGGLPSGPRPQR
jgi:hypothetical protein